MISRHLVPACLLASALLVSTGARADDPPRPSAPVVATQLPATAVPDESQVERLGRTLEGLAAEQKRAQRIGSVVSLGVGAVVTAAGVVLVARGDSVGDESKTSRGFVLGFGIGGVVAGGIGLFVSTPYERLHGDYLRARTGSPAASSVLMDIERRWQDMADRERTGRLIGGSILGVAAAAGLGIGGYYVLRDDTGGREANERRAAAGLISAGFLASGAAFLFTTAGSMEGALRTYRDASGRSSPPPMSAGLKLGGGPVAGGGGVMTLGGAF